MGASNEVATEMLLNHQNIEVTQDIGFNPVVLATELPNDTIFFKVIKHERINLNVTTISDGTTALHTAVSHGNQNRMKALLELGASPNVLGAQNLTPLMLACLKNNSYAVAVLLEAFNINIHVTFYKRITAFDIALFHGNADVIGAFLRHLKMNKTVENFIFYIKALQILCSYHNHDWLEELTSPELLLSLSEVSYLQHSSVVEILNETIQIARFCGKSLITDKLLNFSKTTLAKIDEIFKEEPEEEDDISVVDASKIVRPLDYPMLKVLIAMMSRQQKHHPAEYPFRNSNLHPVPSQMYNTKKTFTPSQVSAGIPHSKNKKISKKIDEIRASIKQMQTSLLSNEKNFS